MTYSVSTCVPTATTPCDFTCCSNGPFVNERLFYGRPYLDFGLESALMVVFLGLVLLGGLLNVASPAFIQPKGVLAPIFYQRFGSGLFLRGTPAELFAVLCVLAFYITRFVAFYNAYSPYEVANEANYPDSNGRARAAAQAFEEIYYASLPIQVSLGGKNLFWRWVAGVPVERTAVYHAYHGYFSTLVLIAAWICFAIGGLTTRTFGSKFCFCDVNPTAGLIALIFQCLLTLTSLPVVRRKNWEYFYLMGHFQLLFPLFWATMFNDRPAVFPWFVVTAVQFGFGDVNLRFYMKVFQKTRVLGVDVKNDNVACLRLTKKAEDGSGKTLGLLTSTWESGSYVWIAVNMPNANPLVGKAPPPFNKDWACYHPITISSPPIAKNGKVADDFTLHIKSMGEGTWSQALVDKIKTMKEAGEAPGSLWVWLGGPNGKLKFQPQGCDRIVMCAGGIGVTPFIALAQELHLRALKGEMVPEFDLVWVERQLENFLVFEEELKLLTTGETPLKLKLYCTNPGTHTALEVCGVPVSSGRPKFVELLGQAKTLSNVSKTVGKLVVGVYSCGPPKMMQAVREAVQGASSSQARFYLHEETFEL